MTDVKISDLTDLSPVESDDLMEIERPGDPDLSGRIPVGSNLAKLAGGQAFGGGFTTPSHSLGTVSSGTVTPDVANGHQQHLTRDGAFTLAAPSADCEVSILVTNGASAGAITFSGFTVGDNTGDDLTTTNTHRFMIYIRRVNSIASYSIQALQ